MAAAGSAVGPDELQQWEEDGYFVLRGFYDPDRLDALRPPSNTQIKQAAKDGSIGDLVDNPLFQRCVIFGNPITNEDPDAIVKLEGMGRLKEVAIARDSVAVAGPVGANPLDRLLALHRLCHDPRLVSVSRQLLGAKAELMKDKYIFKQAQGGGGFVAHQDMTFMYSRVATDAVNFGIAFNDADAENGALEVAPGLQRHLFGRHILPRTEMTMPDGACDDVPWKHLSTKKGDVVVFSAYMLHQSTINKSPRDRAVYYVTYGIPGPLPRPAPSLYKDYYELHHAWVQAGYPTDVDADLLLGPHRPRPSLITVADRGVGVTPHL